MTPAKADLARAGRLVRDFPYWARRLYTIRDKHDALVKLYLNRAQVRVLEAEDAMRADTGRVRLFVLKGRQGGITTAEQAKHLHLVWHRDGAKAFTLAHDRDHTDIIFEITRRALENFDAEFLWRLGKRRTREVSFPRFDSSFYTGTAGTTRIGRGLTLLSLHGSEFAFWDDPKGILASVSPSLERPRTRILLETTASSYDSDAHRFYKDARAGRNGFRALFIPWWDCDPALYRMPLEGPKDCKDLADDERMLVEQFGLDREQIKWRRDAIARLGRDMFLREYAEDDETCWLVSGSPVFEAGVLKALLAKAPQPTETYLQHALEVFALGTVGGHIRPVVPPGERDVIIGCDVAEGVGGDRSSWVARSYPRWRLLAKFADNRVEPERLAAILNEWGRLYTNERGDPAYLVVEKNAHGITVLRKLRDTHKYPLHRVYHRMAVDKTVDEQTSRIGWLTSAETQPMMIDAARDLFRVALDGGADVPSAEAIRDGFAVQRDEHGRASLTGRDVLVAEALAWLGRDRLPRPGGVVRW